MDPKQLIDAEAAFNRVWTEAEALAAEQVSRANVNVTAAASKILGHLDGVMAFRDRLAEVRPFDFKLVESIRDYALAAWFCHATTVTVASDPPALTTLVAEATQLRRRFSTWANAFPFPPDTVADIRRRRGDVGLAVAVTRFARLYRAHWSIVENNCPIKMQHIERAELIGDRLFLLASQNKTDKKARVASARDRIRRTWTLADNAWEEIRRALLFIRHHEGDADKIAPSLRKNRGPRANR